MNEITEEMKPYWSFCDALVVIDGILIKNRCTVVPEDL